MGNRVVLEQLYWITIPREGVTTLCLVFVQGIKGQFRRHIVEHVNCPLQVCPLSCSLVLKTDAKSYWLLDDWPPFPPIFNTTQKPDSSIYRNWHIFRRVCTIYGGWDYFITWSEQRKICRKPPFFPSNSGFRQYSCSAVITIVFLTTQVLRENPPNFSGLETAIQARLLSLAITLFSSVWKVVGAGTAKFGSLMH